jgi:hypothetical protein
VSTEAPLTTQGKDKALRGLAHRRNHKPKQIDNASLPAGMAMYFYCVSCGHLSDIKGELYTDTVKKLCGECQALKEMGWLE